MATYVCFKCGSRVEIDDVNKPLSCPVCAGKIFFKEAPPVKKRVKAI